MLVRIWEIDPCALLVGISNGAAATGNITTIMDVPQKTTSRTTVRGSPDGSAGKKICLQCRTPRFNSWVRKVPWKRDRLPTPVFLGFPAGSDGKESACNAGDLGSAPGVGRSPGGRHGNPVQHSCLENPHGWRNLAGYSPWGHKESDMTERLSTAQNYYMTQQSHLCICTQNN